MNNNVPENMEVKLLIDNSVDSLAKIMQGAAKEQHLLWGDRFHTVRIVGLKRKAERSEDEVWLRRQIECLPTMARLGRQGPLIFHTYDELTMEAWRRPGSYPALPIGDLFNGIAYQHVGPAVERSRIFASDLFTEREELIDFCNWLLCADVERVLANPAIAVKFPKFERDNLANVQRFRDICDGLSERQFPDAFHLWTGEVNDLHFFVTTDRKFIRAMRDTKRIELLCNPISPEELLDEMMIEVRDPFPFEPDQFYTVWGARG